MKRHCAHFKAGGCDRGRKKTNAKRSRFNTFNQESSSDSSDVEESIGSDSESQSSSMLDDCQLGSFDFSSQARATSRYAKRKATTLSRFTKRKAVDTDDSTESDSSENETSLESDDDGTVQTSDSSASIRDSYISDDDSTIILSNSETDYDSDDSVEDRKPTLAKDLSHFIAVSGTPQEYTNLLLKILHKHDIKSVPKCYQTLMQTPKEKICEQPMESGSYIHYKSLLQCILQYEHLLKDVDEIQIEIGIDGFKPFKATALDIWPLMGAISDSIHLPPFLIGCYAGHKAPKDPDILLSDLLSDIEHLNESGVYFPSTDRTVPVRVRIFIMDAPARAMICGIKSHSSYEGCPHCIMDEKIFGDAVNYTASCGSTKRDDRTFSLRLHPEHHKKRFLKDPSRLEQCGFGMVSQFPLDPMHAIDLGVTKKMLKLLKLKKTGISINVDGISQRMLNFRHYRPSDFAKDCRSLDYVHYFKATELRTFLFYGCIVFLKDLVDEHIYKHWLLLHCAVRLLSNNDVSSTAEVDLGEELLEEYVRLFPLIYGEENVSYNVHVLLHVAFYVRLYGPLDNFSMFKFENFIQLLKKLIRKADKPLQQIYKRLEELSKIHNGPVVSTKFNAFDINENDKDSFIAIKHKGEIVSCRFLGFSEDNGTKYVKVLRCLNTSSFYSWPIDSILLGELSYERLSINEETFMATEIHYKYCRIPFQKSFVLVPILHTTGLKFDYNESI